MDKIGYGVIGAIAGAAAIGGMTYLNNGPAQKAAVGSEKMQDADRSFGIAAESESPKFERAADFVAGVNVVLATDNCAASVIFENAVLRSYEEGGLHRQIAIPLDIAGGTSDLQIDTRGYLASNSDASAILIAGGRSTSLLDNPTGEGLTYLTSRQIEKLGTPAAFRLDIQMAQPPAGADPAIFSVDTIDLVLTSCQDSETARG